MKRILLTAVCLLWTGIVSAQITLEECHRLAQRNYPLIRQYDLIDKSTEYSLANARRGYLPQVSFSAQASYQSDVTEFPEAMNSLYQQMGLDMKGLNKDQYKAMLEVNQTIWDGGVIKSNKEAATAEGEVSRRNNEVDLYAVRDRINQLYFGILTLGEQLAQNALLQNLLQTNYDNIKAYLDNGTAMQSDLDAVRVEQLTAVQQRTQIEAGLNAYRTMLSVMTGRTIAPEETFEKPVFVPVSAAEVKRPELDLFQAQNAQFEAQRTAARSATMPRLGAFVQGAYGNPGLNLFKDMVENKFSWYYIAGIRLQWNIGGYYTKKNNLRKIELGQQRVANRQETFLFNTGLQVTQQQNAIDKMQKVMRDDDQIIALRTSIRKAAEARLANGTISVSDLIREINSENRAMLDKSAHEIELLKNCYDLKYTVND